MYMRSFYHCMKCSHYSVQVSATAPVAAQNDIERHLFKTHGITKDRASAHYMRTRKKP